MSVSLVPSVAGGSSALRSGKYLVFQLGGEAYAVPVLKVREIVTSQAIVMVPQTPPQYKGVINLRGKIIPVIDLRAQFAMPAVADDSRSSIVVMQLESAQSVLLGVLVDEVSEVVNLSPADIEAPPKFGETHSGCLLGIAKAEGRVIMLLDMDRTVSGEEVVSLTKSL